MAEMPNKEEHESNKNKKKIQKLEEEITQLKADVDHWKNEYYRAYADTKNLRASLEKDHREVIKYRAEGFVEELLPILDSFYIVLSNEPDDPALKNYLTGFKYLYKNMLTVLENEGVSEVVVKVGDKFDPSTMDATDTEENEEENKVLKVSANGYKLHDRLIRPARVVVSVKPKKEETKSEQETDA